MQCVINDDDSLMTRQELIEEAAQQHVIARVGTHLCVSI